MKLFVVRYTGANEPPPDDLRRLLHVPGTKVVDISPRMLLVEAQTDALTELVNSIPYWTIAPETFVPPPSPHRMVRRGLESQQ